MLKVATAGSVDDGKSTLIGRLLHDAKALMADELGTAADLARLTDGLRAEREQGITIDVAYRHFATPNRRFVLHDCPGHAQYTRNMATGASTADLALVLVDARRGMTEQSRRHLAIAALLGVPGVTVLVNKMDLAGYAEERFDAVVREVIDWASRLGLHGVGFIPVSALHGDNVVNRSEAMPWYGGPALLEHLEAAPAGNGVADGPARLPVQYVIRADGTRWYAGRLASGTLEVGDELVVLPAGTRTRVRAFEHGRDTAVAPHSIAVALTDELDVGRGDLLARPAEAPTPVRELAATVCWLGDEPARPGARYLLKHTTRTVPAKLEAIEHRLDVTALAHEPADELELNAIGRVRLRLGAPLMPDPYDQVHATGAFIVVDEATNDTVGAGMTTT
ncbi:MAG: sulfate adenylyltransferase subunit 1 [Solirubrobacteraceae bacterium]